jgi:hypothetical protein
LAFLIRGKFIRDLIFIHRKPNEKILELEPKPMDSTSLNALNILGDPR